MSGNTKHIWRAVLVTSLFVAACMDGGETTPDAFVDTSNPPGSGSGSGAAMFGTDPTPADVTLEWIVVGLSVIVVGGSVRARRRDAKPKLFDL